jgi:hypothetical protein
LQSCIYPLELWGFDDILNIHFKKNMLHTLLLCSTKVMGMDPSFVATFNFLKSIQILSLPFFLGIITMGDNHVASSI